MAHISRISIGRLYNLGNYEHVRYDISLDLEDGDDPGTLVQSLSNILAALKPGNELNFYDRETYRELKGKPESELSDFQREKLKMIEAVIIANRARATIRTSALVALKDLGGTRIFTDAKEKWEDEDAF